MRTFSLIMVGLVVASSNGCIIAYMMNNAVPGSGVSATETRQIEDFHAIGERIEQVGGDPIGYDHCYVVDGEAGEMRMAATVRDPESGRVMEISTTQPGIQFYSGNFLDETPGSGGFKQHHAFCLETQHYPDSPNQTSFPSTILKPGDTYKQTTVHKFSAE